MNVYVKSAYEYNPLCDYFPYSTFADDETRVCLSMLPDNPLADYINASHIQVRNGMLCTIVFGPFINSR